MTSQAQLSDDIRQALNDPTRMADIVMRLARDLNPGDLVFIRNLLVLLDTAARLARNMHGDAPGTSARILHDVMHEIRWRVSHYYRCRPKHGVPGLGRGVLNEWVRHYAWMDEDAFTDNIVASPEWLVKKDLYSLALEREFSEAATQITDDLKTVMLPHHTGERADV